MSAIHLYSTIGYITSIVRIAASKGIHLEIGTDFTAFRDIPKTQPQRKPVAPLFDPDHSSVSSANGFWVKGVDDRGEIVHTQAVRLIDLSGIGLAEHLAQYLRDYRPHGDAVDPEKSRCVLSPVSSRITGKVCYLGEAWLKSGRNNLGGSLTAALTRLAPAMSSLLWWPDYFFCLMEPFVACKGLSARFGYTHLEQGSIFWHRRDQTAPLEEWLGWMSQEDLRHLLRVPPENFDRWYPLRDSSRKGPPETA